MHVILRFELEQDIINGRVSLRDLPQVWNEQMRDYLGVDVPDDANGVLQDTHWASGLIGYFSTYLLGSVMSVQIWEKARRGRSAISRIRSNAESSAHSAGGSANTYTRTGGSTRPRRRSSGRPATIDAKPYLAYLRAKYGAGVAA